MRARGWPASQLASAAGLSVSTVTRIIGGDTRRVSRDTIQALGMALQVDLVSTMLQTELELALEDDFLQQARDVIQEHARRAREDLGGDAEAAEIFGVVSLRVHQPRSTRLYERVFPLGPQRTGTPRPAPSDVGGDVGGDVGAYERATRSSLRVAEGPDQSAE